MEGWYLEKYEAIRLKQITKHIGIKCEYYK